MTCYFSLQISKSVLSHQHNMHFFFPGSRHSHFLRLGTSQKLQWLSTFPWLPHASSQASDLMLCKASSPGPEAAKSRETQPQRSYERDKHLDLPPSPTNQTHITFFDDSSRVRTGSESWKSWVSSTTCTSFVRMTALCRAPRSAMSEHR